MENLSNTDLVIFGTAFVALLVLGWNVLTKKTKGKSSGRPWSGSDDQTHPTDPTAPVKPKFDGE